MPGDVQNNVWMWHLGIWFGSERCGGAGLDLVILEVISNREDFMNLCVIGAPLSSRPAVGELHLPALGREERAPHTLDK